MTQQQICVKCNRYGTQNFSRCGHILHKECLKYLEYPRKCPSCEITLSCYFQLEQFLMKIKTSDMHVSDAAELCICLENFYYGPSCEYGKSRSYHDKILEDLQKLGLDINDDFKYTRALIRNSCINDDLEKVNILMDNGLDLNEFGAIVLTNACEYSSYDIFERMIQAGIKLNDQALINLISSKNFELLNRAIILGADVNAKEYYSDKRTVHAAANSGSIKILQLLIESGADFNVSDNEGNSIVHYACIYKLEPEMLEYLIESGFDFTVRNKKQKTPLMLAIENYSNASVVEYLIQNKVDVNIHDIDGNTPLHIAAMKCELEIIKVLIREGSDLNAKNNKLQTPLHVVGQGFEPLFRDILEKGDDTEILNLSRDLKIETIIMLLLENGADANTLDNEGKSPFYYLHRIISIELKMKFINSGADLTIKDNSGVSIMVSMFELGTRHY